MKELSRRFIIGVTICIISAGLFSYLAGSISSGTIERFDRSIINFVQGLEASWLTVILKTFTWIGSAYVVVPVTLTAFFLLYFVYRRRGQAVLFVTVIVGTISSNELLKLYFQRERPVIHRIIDAGGLSFPSGHTMMAVSLYAIIAYVLWQNLKSSSSRVLLILFAVFMIFMIAVSRIYLGVHYPSDIAGGVAASIFLVTLLIMIFEFYWDKKRRLEGDGNR